MSTKVEELRRVPAHPAAGRRGSVSLRTTYRLRVLRTHDSLEGYVFTDDQHANDWARQPFVSAEFYRFEPVVVHDKPCRCECGGSGNHTRRVVERDHSRPNLPIRAKVGDAHP